MDVAELGPFSDQGIGGVRKLEEYPRRRMLQPQNDLGDASQAHFLGLQIFAYNKVGPIRKLPDKVIRSIP